MVLLYNVIYYIGLNICAHRGNKLLGLGIEIREGFTADLEREAARKIISAIDKWRKGGRIKTAQRRWLFELIQNALDISTVQGNPLEIDITTGENQITFRHSAGYFKPQEIRALIYAYSTKPYERESQLAGRFATGFLVSHITSRKVYVKSILRKNGIFYEIETTIDRESEAIDEIFANFTKSFDQLNSAIQMEKAPTIFWTQYTYEVSDSIGKEAIKVGISEIKKCFPFLFAFNRIKKISINGEEYIKEEITKEDTLVEQVGSTQLWLERSQDVEIAISVNSKECKIIDLSSFPKLYVKGLPLIETGNYLKIPFVINSPQFGTTEDRNTLENIEENEEILKKAFLLYHRLIERLSKLPEMRGLYFLSDFRLVSNTIVSENPLWKELNSLLETHIPHIVQNYPLVNTSERREVIAKVIFPSRAIKSIELQPGNFSKFYNLLANMNKIIPARDELECWIKVVSNLVNEFGDMGHITIYDIVNLQDDIKNFVGESFHKLKELGEEFNLPDPKQFLISFFELVDDLYKRKIIESSDFADHMLLDQSGLVGSYEWENGKLCIDQELSEDFKDIVQKIGWKIRQELVSEDFAIYKIIKDLVRDIQDVNKALQHVISNYTPSEENLKEEPWGDKVNGWIDLFRWCAENEKFYKDFPIITKDRKVRQIEDLDEETVVVSFKNISIDEEFEGIYPESRILHPAYLSTENSDLIMEHLMKYDAFVTYLPIYKSEITLGWNKLKSVLIENNEVSKVDHKIKGLTDSISVLPFWNEVIGRISEYQERAESLFRFVALCLLKNDKNWDKSQTVKCSCKKANHKIIPSQWLASLKTDAWVPLKVKDNDEEKIVKTMATRESIETLLVKISLENLIDINPEKITKLLMHFGFDELDLKIKLQSIERGATEEQVRKEVSILVDITKLVPNLAEIAKQDTHAFKEAIEKLKESFGNKTIADENRTIGKNLEVIIAKILSSLEGVAEIKPVYKGGDLELWPEMNEGWDSGLIEIKPYIIEVKFTSGTRVHLSKAQGEMSKEKKEHHIVLVVKNAARLRDLLLSRDTSNNNIPEQLVLKIIENSHIVEDIYQKLGSFPNLDEIDPDSHGYWVKRKLWDNKPDILTWINRKCARVT